DASGGRASFFDGNRSQRTAGGTDLRWRACDRRAAYPDHSGRADGRAADDRDGDVGFFRDEGGGGVVSESSRQLQPGAAGYQVARARSEVVLSAGGLQDRFRQHSALSHLVL